MVNRTVLMGNNNTTMANANPNMNRTLAAPRTKNMMNNTTMAVPKNKGLDTVLDDSEDSIAADFSALIAKSDLRAPKKFEIQEGT